MAELLLEGYRMPKPSHVDDALQVYKPNGW